jgi:hypothetical protein
MARLCISVAVCAVAIAGVAPGVFAQTPADCLTALRKIGFTGTAPNNPCQALAVDLAATAPPVTRAADAILTPDPSSVAAVFTQRDLQARHPQQPALGGTAAQGQAVPTVQPAGVAAGTIAAVGTNAGQDAIAALSLNPAILVLGDAVTRQLARYSRFLDVTMFVPVSNAAPDEDTAGPDRLRYFGARARVNVRGLAAGSDVWDRSVELITNWIARAGRNVARVQEVLATAPDLMACAVALKNDARPDVIAAGCGRTVTFEVDLQEAEELRTELARVRREADSRYFGADIRYDHGDPTLGEVADAAGDFLFAGLSYGRRLGGGADGGAAFGVRSRLGVRHATLDSSSTSEFAAEGGFGFDVSRALESDEINGSAAIEFRYGNAEAALRDRFQTNFLMFRGSFLLPVTAGNSISLNFGAPLAGDVSPTLSVNFNWGVLLPDRR